MIVSRCAALIAVIASAVVACSPGSLASEEGLPPNVQDPSRIRNAEGALAFYRGVLAQLPGMFDGVLTHVGIMTDELAALPAPMGVSGTYTALDSRRSLSGAEHLYQTLHKLRAEAREARGFLSLYAEDRSPALRGHLYAVEGYAEIFLADLFCSGIPLSTVDFGGDYTLAAGSTTAEVYDHAVRLFDSALAIAGDSVSVQYLAAVGRGRALLALGDYVAAAASVAEVPDDYRYQFVYTLVDNRLLNQFVRNYKTVPAQLGVGDREGMNGLDYRSSGDARTAAVVPWPQEEGDDFLDYYDNPMYVPAKYPLEAPVTLTMADGVEARLIEAEAAFRGDPSSEQWLALLNHLRRTAWPTITPAITAALPDTTDPGTPAGRRDLLFRERAFWLYLTGHRQGDMRRLVRQYQRTPDAIYPTGPYPGGNGQYGTEINVSVPSSEQNYNPKFTGCIHRGA